jgi:uncharacterized protein (TIGR02266 family)
MSSDNRRQHERTPISILVQFRSDSFDAFIAEYSLNISMGGIFIKTSHPHELGSLVYLQFSLKDGSRLIEGMGRVVRVNHVQTAEQTQGMGIEFLNFDEASKALVREICTSRNDRA